MLDDVGIEFVALMIKFEPKAYLFGKWELYVVYATNGCDSIYLALIAVYGLILLH